MLDITNYRKVYLALKTKGVFMGGSIFVLSNNCGNSAISKRTTNKQLRACGFFSDNEKPTYIFGAAQEAKNQFTWLSLFNRIPPISLLNLFGAWGGKGIGDSILDQVNEKEDQYSMLSSKSFYVRTKKWEWGRTLLSFMTLGILSPRVSRTQSAILVKKSKITENGIKLISSGKVRDWTGNKGGTYHIIQEKDEVKAFINVHLDSGSEEKRKEQYDKIIEQIKSDCNKHNIRYEHVKRFETGDFNERVDLEGSQVKPDHLTTDHAWPCPKDLVDTYSKLDNNGVKKRKNENRLDKGPLDLTLLAGGSTIESYSISLHKTIHMEDYQKGQGRDHSAIASKIEPLLSPDTTRLNYHDINASGVGYKADIPLLDTKDYSYSS